MAHRHQLAYNVGEGDLRGSSQANEDRGTDQCIDVLGCCSNDTADQGESCASDEEVSSSENIRKAANQCVANGDGEGP